MAADCDMRNVRFKSSVYAPPFDDRTDVVCEDVLGVVRKLFLSRVRTDDDGLCAAAMGPLIQMRPLPSVRLDATQSSQVHEVRHGRLRSWILDNYFPRLESDSTLGAQWYVCLGR